MLQSARVVAESPPVKVDARYGPFEVFGRPDLISKSILQYGEWAQQEIDVLGHFISPGDSVVDAGAFIGTHSRAFSSMVGRRGKVHAFEPNPAALEILRENSSIGRWKNIAVYGIGLADSQYSAVVQGMDDSNIGATSVILGESRSDTPIFVQALDSLSFDRVDFIKADIEGQEFRLLKGASNTVALHRPLVFLECLSLTDARDVLAWCTDENYRMHGLISDAFNPSNFRGQTENIFGKAKECGLLLIPREKTAEFEDVIDRLTIPVLHSMEDIALLLLHKPQFAYEVLQKTSVAEVLGIAYPSPASEDQSATASELKSLQAEHLRESLASDQRAQEMVLEFSNREAELKDRLNQVLLSLTERERSWREASAAREADFGRERWDYTMRIQALEQESLQQALASAERERAAAAAHIERERELMNKNSAVEREINELQRAGVVAQETAFLTVRNLEERIQEILRNLHEQSMAHVRLERDMKEQLRQRNEEVQKQRAASETLAAELNEIRGSLSWRLTAPLHRIARRAQRVAANANPRLGTVTVGELLALDDQFFVRAAYKSILGRDPDPDGMDFYVRSVRAGVGKLDVLRQIRSSPEGRTIRAEVVGLNAALRRAAWRKLPIIRDFGQQECAKPAEHTRPAEETDTELVARSDLFDAEYYLNAYADVAAATIDPLLHFMKYGWREGRNPSRTFDTGFYLETHADVRAADVNPLVHYLKFGMAEKRIKQPVDLLEDISVHSRFLSPRRNIRRSTRTETIDVIVPIYNGFDFLNDLFASIVKNTTGPFRLIVVDDCSPDGRVKRFLRDFHDANPQVDLMLIENSENLGFVGSVNKAVAPSQNHFVILNSDTEVPEMWLERLMYPILEMDNIATTTPFTNSGTICSFPRYLADNSIFEGCNLATVDGYFQLVEVDQNLLQLPTGVGFCMGVNRSVVDKIGMFDLCFGRGYGEENDWCMRAQAVGYRNLHVPNLFVYHKHGGSFPSEERRKLIEQNLITLRKRHPTYEPTVHECIRENKFKALRDLLVLIISANEFKTTMIIDNELGGGAHQFRKSEVQSLLDQDEGVMVVSLDSQVERVARLSFKFRSHSIAFSVGEPNDLMGLFELLKVEAIIVNSLVSFFDIEKWLILIPRLRNQAGARLIFLLHDYFAICPSYTLLNDANVYCDVPGDLRICEGCMQRNQGEFKQFGPYASIPEWRSRWKAFLDSCDEVIAFSSASLNILRRAYPDMSESKLRVKPHDIRGRFRHIYVPRQHSDRQTIGILGGISTAKGSAIVRELVNLIEHRDLPAKVVLIGDINVQIDSEAFEKTGKYSIENLEELVLQKGIDVFLVPSIWPETYSFTTDEIMQMGYPLIVFNLGAPAERVADYPLGKVIEVADLPEALFGKQLATVKSTFGEAALEL